MLNLGCKYNAGSEGRLLLQMGPVAVKARPGWKLRVTEADESSAVVVAEMSYSEFWRREMFQRRRLKSARGSADG